MFYIFHGEDEHTKQETLSKLLARLGDQAMLDLNTTRFSGVVPLTTLRQTAETVPFLAPARVVVVADLLAAKPGKQYMDELIEFLPKVPDTTRLIFLETQTLRENHPLVKLAQEEEEGIERAFPLPEGGELDRWIGQQAQKKGGEISAPAAHLLASLVGNDLHILDNELEKLVNYKTSASSPTIEAEDVALLSPYVAEVSIFDLVDAIGNRDERRATALYQKKLEEGTDPFYLFSMFTRQFRLLIQVRELMDAGYDAPAVARELSLHKFVAGKLYGQAHGFDLEELERVYRHLLEMDLAVKSGQADIRTALDLLVAGLTVD